MEGRNPENAPTSTDTAKCANHAHEDDAAIPKCSTSSSEDERTCDPHELARNILSMSRTAKYPRWEGDIKPGEVAGIFGTLNRKIATAIIRRNLRQGGFDFAIRFHHLPDPRGFLWDVSGPNVFDAPMSEHQRILNGLSVSAEKLKGVKILVFFDEMDNMNDVKTSFWEACPELKDICAWIFSTSRKITHMNQVFKVAGQVEVITVPHYTIIEDCSFQPWPIYFPLYVPPFNKDKRAVLNKRGIMYFDLEEQMEPST